jgi:2-keto-3-deoxy-L-rhamnonate aldolase RhmA
MDKHNAASGTAVWLGLFQQLPLPAVSRYLARQGWDWIVLDLQHGAMNFETAYECIHTIRAHGARPLVRTAVGNPSDIQKVLDLGAQGVVVPMVNSPEEARQAAQAAKYPPLGCRSRGGDLTYHYGETYTENANRDTLLLVQIEHIDAVRSVEQILAVDGVDGCFMGQVDLALSMGLGDKNFHDNAEHRAGIERSLQACLKLGKLACYNAFSLAEARQRAAQGFRGITLRSDVDHLLERTQQLLADLRESVPQQRP